MPKRKEKKEAPTLRIPLSAEEKRKRDEIERKKEKQSQFSLESIEETLGERLGSKFEKPKSRDEYVSPVYNFEIPDAFDITKLALSKAKIPSAEDLREKE